MIRILPAFAIAAFAALSVQTAAVAPAAAAPLLMEGKRTLYQRVLMRPEATLRAERTDEAGEALAPFDVFFVFERDGTGDDAWLKVGRDRAGDGDGWVRADETVAWKQTIVAAFTNPSDRERALLFRTDEKLDEVYKAEDLIDRYARLREDAAGETIDDEGPVISIEPENHIDIDSQFYVLPILDHRSYRMPNRRRSKLLELASVSRTDAGEGRSRDDLMRDYTIGVVFVIDTTSSMNAYVDQVREAVRKLQQRIGSSPEADRVRFGLVGFRDSTALAPELGYVTRTLLPLTPDATADKFLAAIETMDVAETSSSGFNEDSVAGVMEALNESDWEPFGGRYMVLVTDAGPREPGDTATHEELAPGEVNQLLQREGVALYALHLKTRQGINDHDYAGENYRALSRFGQRDLYYAVDGGDVAQFRAKVDALGAAMVQQFTDTMNGDITEAEEAGESDDAAVGRAMQMAYLGRMEGTAAPSVFKGWVTDRDPTNPNARPLEARILLSRNELATTVDLLEEAIDIGNATIQRPGEGDFFAKLKDAIARITRDPDRANDVETLGDALGEYLEGLPYESDITGMTQARWDRLSAAREREMVDTLESKLAALRRIANAPDRWEPLFEGAPAGEYVTTIPLNLLP